MYQTNKIKTKDIDELITQTRKETNDIFYKLHDKLLVVGTLILSVFPAVLLSEPVFQRTKESPQLFLWVVITAILSITFGILQLWWDWKFFRGLTKALGYVKAYISGKQLEKVQVNKVNKFIDKDGSGTNNTGNLFLVLQSISLFASFVLIFIVIRLLLV